MRLKCLLLGAALAVAMVGGGAANGARSPASSAGLPSGSSSTAPREGSKNPTHSLSTVTAHRSVAPEWNNAGRIDDDLFNHGVNRAVGSRGGSVAAGFIPNPWRGNALSVAPVDHLSPGGLDIGRANPRRRGANSAIVVSEPATWGMMLLGVGLMAVGLRTMRVERGGPADDDDIYLL